MEPIKIAIVKEGKDILITSTEGGQIRITQSNNELKASETLEFLNYTENKKYILILTGSMGFGNIIEKINPVDENS